MKTLLLALLATTTVSANQTCKEDVNTSRQPVEYIVNKNIPKHLVGATITITLADGPTSTVPADKFMVVPRKQYTVVAESVSTVKTLVCNVNSKKNTVSLQMRKDVTGLSTNKRVLSNGNAADVDLEKDLIPGVNYYRQEVIGDTIGFGVGIDNQKIPSISIGIDF